MLASLPGENFQLSLYFLRQAYHSLGCWTLNQLQRILWVSGRTDSSSVVEHLLLRLDEQGLEVSSLWEQHQDRLLAERGPDAASWPRTSRMTGTGRAGILPIPQLQLDDN